MNKKYIVELKRADVGDKYFDIDGNMLTADYCDRIHDVSPVIVGEYTEPENIQELKSEIESLKSTRAFLEESLKVLMEKTIPKPTLPWKPIYELSQEFNHSILLISQRTGSAAYIHSPDKINVKVFYPWATHFMKISDLPRPKPEPVKYQPDSFWHVIFDCKHTIVQITDNGFGFLVVGHDVAYALSEAQFINDVEL
jgi:hypothetical protein